MSRPRSKEDLLGLALIAGCIVLLGTAGGYGVYRHGALVHDPFTLAQKGHRDVGVTEAIIDTSDPLTPAQGEALRIRFRHLAQFELPENALLTVWGLGDFGKDGLLVRLFSLHNPGREANWFDHDPEQVAADFDRLFGDPLAAVAESLTTTRHSAVSPILESVQDVGEQPEFADATGPRRVLIVSDMLQNTKRFSTYRDGYDYSALLQSPACHALRADLRGATVEVIYLPRPRDAAFQGPEHRMFWRKYLTDCGASRVTIERL